MDEQGFWAGILRSVEVVPRDITNIRGFSGLSHEVLAGGVDEQRRRLVLIDGDADSRVAAYVQSDVQAAMQDVKVVVAKVSYFDRGQIVQQLLSLTPTKGRDELVQQMTERMTPILRSYITNARASQEGRSDMPTGLMNNLTTAMLGTFFALGMSFVSDVETYRDNLEKQLLSNAGIPESTLGLCPFPLHTFSPDEMEILKSGSDSEHIRELLRDKGILQYFFPAPDHLALGLIERGEFTVTRLLDGLGEARDLGL